MACYVPTRLESEKCVFKVITELVAHLPIILLHRPESRYTINMHQIGFDCEELDRDSKAVMKTKLSLKRSNQQRRIKVAKAAKKSILDHFPNMPDIATEFIKANGFKVQEKRRDTTISSCGVLEKDITENYRQAIPGLCEFGISDSTVRFLFKPVKEELLMQNVKSQ